MLRNKGLPCLTAGLLAAWAAVGSVLCLTSAFGFDLKGWMILLWIGSSLLFAMAGLLPKKWGLLFWLAPVVLGLHLWQRSPEMGYGLEYQTEAFLYSISRYYNNVYTCGVIRWSDRLLRGIPVEQPVAAIGAVISCFTAWALCRRNRLWPVVILLLLPPAVCVGVSEAVPSETGVFLLLTALTLMLLTQLPRRRDSWQGCKLTAILLIPVMLAAALLLWKLPREMEVPLPQKLAQQTVTLFEDLALSEEMAQRFSGTSGKKVDLKNAGPLAQYKYRVMDVTYEKDDTLYLRGRIFDQYDGTSWSASEDMAMHYDYRVGSYQGDLQISTRAVHDVLYTATYSELDGIGFQWSYGTLVNQNRLKEYTCRKYQLHVTDPYKWTLDLSDVEGLFYTDELSQYLTLPEATAAAAAEYLERYDLWSKIGAQGPEALARHLKTQAVYDLETEAMPASETDFAMWFLEDSDTGYCVHFATAAAVLLRQAGIPTRYVTGYLVETKANETVTVRGKDAHAWVEYWTVDNGWQILEATPQGTAVETFGPTDGMLQPQATEETEETGLTKPEDTMPEEEFSKPDDDTTSGNLPGDGEGKNVDWGLVWSVVKWLLGLGAAVGTIWGQRLLRLELRRRRREKLKPNQLALELWRETKRYAKLLGTSAPEQLRELAEKAKFSQHTLTREELSSFRSWYRQAAEQLKRHPLLWQVYYRLILALY